MGLFLVTTADERSWKFDRPVLFLGEWCCRYDRREIWTDMDAITAKPYGLDIRQKDHDSACVTKLAGTLLVELSNVLNDYHKTCHSLRYWRIVLGHWLYRYVSIILNRWRTLEQALRDYDVSGTLVFDATSYHLATTDSILFIHASNDDIWNHVLYSKILMHFGSINLEIADHSLKDLFGFAAVHKSSISRARRFKPFIRKTAAGMLAMLSRNNDAVVISSYLPAMAERKLLVSLGQVPQLWRSPALEQIPPDGALRKTLAIHASNDHGFDRFVRAMLMEMLPTCYLEGYQSLGKQVSELPWPKNPKFIFTCNNYDTDEIFKVWVGSKVERGVPYFTGQHGNNHGTWKDSHAISEAECLATSDKCITWGWTDGLPQNVPAFVFKTVGQEPSSYDQRGGLLLIEVCVRHRTLCWDGYAQFERYFNEQLTFVQVLNMAVCDQLTIRLHPEYAMHDRSELDRWREVDPTLKIDRGTQAIQNLIRKSRLVVHSYDSTGLLETLSQNIPTMAFWQDGLSHVREGAKPYYQCLIDAGIIYTSPTSIAEKVNGVWPDVDNWWGSDEVQAARKYFCDRYARVSNQPISDLKQILVKNLASSGSKEVASSG